MNLFLILGFNRSSGRKILISLPKSVSNRQRAHDLSEAFCADGVRTTLQGSGNVSRSMELYSRKLKNIIQ